MFPLFKFIFTQVSNSDFIPPIMTSLVARHRFGISVFQYFSFQAAGVRPPTSDLRPPISVLSPTRKRSLVPALSAQLVTRHTPLVTGRRPAAFTLIELLVVIAILAILAGIAFPAMQGAMDSAKRGQARNDVNQIATAVKNYRLEFGRLPEAGNEIAALTGDNPKAIIFLEAKQAKDGKGGISGEAMMDPWGKAYDIRTDESGKIDGHITTVIVSTTDNKDKRISNVE